MTCPLMKLKLQLKVLLIDIILKLKVTTKEVMTKEPCFRCFCRLVTRSLILRPWKKQIYVFQALLSFWNFYATLSCFQKLQSVQKYSEKTKKTFTVSKTKTLNSFSSLNQCWESREKEKNPKLRMFWQPATLIKGGGGGGGDLSHYFFGWL